VQFRDTISERRIAEILTAEGASVLSGLKPKGPYHIKLKEGQDVREALESFSKYPEVEYAEPNYIMRIQKAR
jgi:hypothetical protein